MDLILESVEATEKDTVVKHETSELTALCPFEFGGPDFYHLKIIYKPSGEVIETKSLKKYIESYRDTEILHEELAEQIHSDIEEVLDPEKLRVELKQETRGGITSKAYVGDSIDC
jgi:7-cyano-7-deazaguanine reductase